MLDEVRVCVNAKTDFLENSFDVSAVRPQFEAFKAKCEALGERSSSAMDFEGKFAQELQGEFVVLIQKCPQKAMQQTAADKAQQKALAKEMMFDGEDFKKGMAKHIAKDAAGMAATAAEQHMISSVRREMIDQGIQRDYNVATNRIDTAGRLLGLFRKKK